MNRNEIKALQAHIGTVDDGVWGSESTYQSKAHCRELMPNPNPWPNSDQASLREFYGRPGDENALVGLLVPDGVVVHYEGNPVKTIRCHAKVAASLSCILVALSKACPHVLLSYAGCYNNRSVRGGSTPSLHAYGAAIDFMPDTNGNRAHWPTGSDMPIEAIECFSREGWLSAGVFWSRDSMHFQATK